MKMQLKLTLLAGAVALAVAGPASAGIVGSNSNQSSDLVLTVVDTTAQTVFVEDLGVNMTTFVAGVSGTASTLAAASPYAAGSNTVLGSTSDAASLASFLASTGTDAVSWNVSASLSGGSGFKGVDMLTTVASSTALTALSNNTLKGDATSLTAQFGVANGLMGSATSVSGATIASVGPSAGVLTPLMNALAPSSMSTVGSSMNFMFLTPSSASTVSKVAAATFGNASGVDTFKLASNGALTYSVAGSVAAVPEPGEWLLMLSGLCLLGFIATRRKNQNTSMMFA